MSIGKKRREFMRAKILANDLVAIVEDAKRGDFDLAVAILTLKGSTPVGAMSDTHLQREWKEGEYDGPNKDAYIRGTETFKSNQFIRELWEGKL